MFLKKIFNLDFYRMLLYEIYMEKKARQDIGKTDVGNLLRKLKKTLNASGVYEWDEVKNFVMEYNAGAPAEALGQLVDAAVQRFNHELDLEYYEKICFKIKAEAYVKTYVQIESESYYVLMQWGSLFWFLKFLLLKLSVEEPDKYMLERLLYPCV